MGGLVTVSVTEGVARVALASPPLNLFRPELIDGLRSAFDALQGDGSVFAAVVAGEGRAFSAGMDVHVLRDLDAAGARDLISGLRDALDAVWEAPFVTVAAVHGACLGAAFELALACDLVVAAEDALFGLPEVLVGVPSVIHAALLPRLAGDGRAADLLFTGRTIGATEAMTMGLVNRVAPPGALGGATEELVASLRAAAPGALRLQKALVRGWRGKDARGAIDAGIAAFAQAYGGGEPREGASAFLEKRPPRWR